MSKQAAQKITNEMHLEEINRCMKEVTAQQLEIEEKDAETTMILEFHAFFAQVLLQCRKEFPEDLQYAAGVYIKNARWYMLIGKTFMNKYFTFLNRVGVLVHEVEHIVRRHMTRQNALGIKPGSREFEIWKIACDLEINQPPVENIPAPPLALHHTEYKLDARRSCEQYYHDLLQIAKEQDKEWKPKGGNSGQGNKQDDQQAGEAGSPKQNPEESPQPDGQSKGDENQQDQSKDNTPKVPQTDSQGRPWLPKEGQQITVIIGNGDPTDATKSPVNQNWDKLIEEAGDPIMIDEMSKDIINEAIRRTQGKYPAHLSEAIQELNAPHKIPWTVLLRRYVSNAIMKCQARTWTRFNKRFPYLDIQGKKRNKGVNVVFVWDTSGSIRHQEIDQAFAELRGMTKTRLADVWVVQCDAAVQWVGKIKDVPRSKEIPITGRGGTDFNPAFEWVEENSIHPDVMVFMTDGYGDYPEEEPGYPVIWLKVEGAIIDVDWGLQLEYPNQD